MSGLSMARKDGCVTIKYSVRNFKKHLNKLRDDIYAQPPDPGHTSMALDGLKKYLPEDISTVLDLGCGQGFMSTAFEDEGLAWEGVTLGEDYKVCHANGLRVHEVDFTFLPFKENSYDLLYARHVLEHSPCPVPTLMEWRRVSKKYLVLISPAPEYWSYLGKNHYSVAPLPQLRWWLGRSGWRIAYEYVFNNHEEIFLKYWREELVKLGHLKGGESRTRLPEKRLDVEYRFLCEKAEEVLT